MRTMGDWELLQEYAKHRSEAAFTELVHRHLNWVYSAARRQVGDPHLAEDVTQAVFVLLARKAGRLRLGTIVAGWLFRTTRFVAARAARNEYRRKRREEAASAMNAITIPPNDTWNQLAPHLDQAVAALSATDRSAILLRFYEKKSLREVGERLGLSEEAAKKRVTRAVEKMRDFLTRRGVVLGGVALVGVLAEQTVQAAPATLTVAVLNGISTSALLPQLARETLTAWRWAKLNLVAVIAAALITTAFLTAKMVPSAISPSSVSEVVPVPARATAMVVPTVAQPAGDVPAKEPNASRRVVNLRVVESQTRQPLAGVEIGVRERSLPESDKLTNGRTDRLGLYEIKLPENDTPYVSVTAHRDGFVPMRVDWTTHEGTFRLPEKFTFTLERATSIGGIIQNEQGQPIPGATVFITFRTSNMGGATEEVNVDIWDEKVSTDAQGRWRFDLAPTDLSKFWIRLAHPDYISGRDTSSTPIPPPGKLRDMSGVMVMKKGLTIDGVVRDENGQPIRSAKVLQGSDRWGTSSPPDTETDAEGRFQFANVTPGEMVLTVQAEGYAPDLKTVNVAPQMEPLKFHLAKGHTIRGRVADREGHPIPSAIILADTWRAHRSVEWHAETDAAGRFVWTSAPPDEVKFNIYRDGFVRSDWHPLIPSEQEQVITLLPLLRVRGTVVDMDTGLPILNIKVIPGSTSTETNQASWHEYGIMTFTNGQYQMAFDMKPSGIAVYIDANRHETVYTNTAHIVRVEAEGYDPTNSRPFKSDEGDVVFDFHLKKGSFVSGVVRALDGTLLENAEVILSTRSKDNMIDPQRGKTDANGRFSLLKSGEDFSLTVTHERGFAYVTREEFQTAAAIIVQPWGRIEGTLRIGSRPGTNETVIAATARSGYQIKAQTDGNGNFVMTNVPPLFLWLSRQSTGKLGEIWRYRTDLGSADVHPGETLHLVLGGTGRAVVGRVLAPAGYDKPIDWNYSRVNLSVFIAPPEHFTTMTDAEKLAWRQAWFKSAEGQARMRNPRGHSVMIENDGTFRIDDVAPGKYRLNVTADAPPENRYTINGPRIGEETRTITISEGDPDEPIDLGDIELTPMDPQK